MLKLRPAKERFVLCTEQDACEILGITADQLKIARACKQVVLINDRLLICNPGHGPLELVDGELRECVFKPEIKAPTFEDKNEKA